MNRLIRKNKPTIAVIGSGTWATALASLLLNNKQDLFWYMRDYRSIDHIKEFHHPRTYLTSVYFDPDTFRMSDDINLVVSSSDILIFAIPSIYFLDEVQKITCGYSGKFIFSAIKGFVSKNNLTIAEYFHRFHHIPFHRIGIISGPCHAEEVSMERLSYMTITSKNFDTASNLCNLFKNKEYLITIAGTDIYGVEYSAALKNVYAIAAGICHGLGYGDNFMAVLLTSAFNEMIKFLNVTHPDKDRITSRSAYLGDLIVTCYSQFSRNRTFGGMLGKGYSIATAQLEMKQIAEGYYASKSIHIINKKYKVRMPIAESVYTILFHGRSPEEIIKKLTRVLL